MSKALTFKVLLTLVLGVVIYLHIDWMTLLEAVSRVDALVFALSTIVFLASFGLLAWRLKLLLGPTEFRGLRWGRLLNINMSSLFYGFVAPSDIGTAIARWYQLTRNRQGRSTIALITLLERLMMLATTALLALVTLYFSSAEQISPFRQAALPILGLLSLFLIGTIAVMLNRKLLSLLGQVVKKLQSSVRNERFRQLLDLYWRVLDFQAVMSTFGSAVLIQFLYHGLLVVRFVLVFEAVGVILPVLDVIWISMTVLFLASLPITIAGLGVREGGYAAILAYYSIAPEIGVLIGLLAFSQLVCAIIWGGFVGLLMKQERNLPPWCQNDFK